MKRTITILALLVVQLIYSQTKNKTADALFDKMYYVEAAKSYELSVSNGDTSKEILQRLGDAYYFNTKMTSASKWYGKLIAEYPNEISAEYLFRYAQSLQGVQNYELAKKWMKAFAEKQKSTDARAKNFSLKNVTLEDIENIKPSFLLENLDINSAYSDFGPMYYKGDLVYSTTIDSSYWKTNKYGWNDQPYLNMQLGKISETQSNVTFKEKFGKEITTQYHEACIAFSPDEKTIYFTRNNYNGKLKRDSKGINNLKIFSATAVENNNGTVSWKDVKELPFNSDNYSVGHPSISKDGKKLYFVSDMPGTIGSTDIFVVDILGNNQFSTPKNLGEKINTTGREMFPYITDQALYFSSDGFLGLGGLDVFESRINDAVFDVPANLGAPLNSNRDDFGYIVNEATNKGFVCSNRKTGKGDDDIYSFERSCNQAINGYIFDAISNNRIAGAMVTLKNSNGIKVAETVSQLDGKYDFNNNVDCNTPYTVEVSKENYNNNTKAIITANSSGKTEALVGLDPALIARENGILKIKIGIIFFDLDKSDIRYDAAIELNKVVLLMTQYPTVVIKIESHTDSRANDQYNLELSDRRAKATRDYIISQGIAAERIESAIGYGETQLINNCSNGVPCTEAQHQINRRSEFIITKM
ncbi:outer membrane protein OmpA-like peptidoglycan-associated protein [Flavobacterium nitrogenifigens]|uniref:Outer membrane protein OmpA-like peptidoglycan-associated protein n=2 Tax=Flavobacterium TaxID=237 RepID=A0A7W7N6A9_9FLAO|nr:MULTISPECIES: OmpA family protein [Flavobacterium]MBB4801620.1 outer membrane protein OmpA-like peptidoglycan-associated protein [Flavobacterium nitrogenifigens]MBB6386578.1 outer membrane protein OmpA-like peptidoglycan-associated protein [Flavobacterium notoginsengisoli]